MRFFSIIVDKETDAGHRILSAWGVDATSMSDAVSFYERSKDDFNDVVQFVDYNTGETIKGPKYDSTEQDITGKSIDKVLKAGIKQKEPTEQLHVEPRDRFQENKNMNELQKFRDAIKECISEIKNEQDPRSIVKEALRGMVKNLLKELSTNNTPEQSKEDKETVLKGYKKTGNERLDKTAVKLQKELETIVHGIDPTWEAYWDDHFQLIVVAQNLLYVRICPKFENTFDVDAMVKLVDRIRAVGLDWEQVKDFVKVNFSNLKNETNADKLTKKSLDNYKTKAVSDKDAGPRSDIVKNRGEKNNGEDAKIKDTKKNDKDYNEPQVKKDEDMPDQPMKQVTEPGKDPESKNKNIKKTDKPKAPKFKNDTELRVGDKKTKKFVKKQVNVKK